MKHETPAYAIRVQYATVEISLNKYVVNLSPRHRTNNTTSLHSLGQIIQCIISNANIISTYLVYSTKSLIELLTACILSFGWILSDQLTESSEFMYDVREEEKM